MTYEILTPFGPSLYKSTLDKDFVDMLQQIAKQSRSVNQNVGNTLAGNLDYQIKQSCMYLRLMPSMRK